ncbi:hypothetical protein MIR68_006589 [Amoeboaphelidium protococcarum]|nr:hypothetical protein MIR68_006589 [Amoeboaphelidium protococcarum]
MGACFLVTFLLSMVISCNGAPNAKSMSEFPLNKRTGYPVWISSTMFNAEQMDGMSVTVTLCLGMCFAVPIVVALWRFSWLMYNIIMANHQVQIRSNTPSAKEQRAQRHGGIVETIEKSFPFQGVLFGGDHSKTATQRGASESDFLSKDYNLVADSTIFDWRFLSLQAVLLSYIIVTVWACVAFGLIGAGKLWSCVGALHNVCELMLIMTLQATSFTRFSIKKGTVIVMVYYTLTEFIVMLLPAPLDAIYFKWQGLILDFTWYQLFKSMMSSQDPLMIKQRKCCRSGCWQLLSQAGFIHAIGNILSTVVHHPYALVAFHLSYCLCFTLLASWLVLHTMRSAIPFKRDKTLVWKVATSTIASTLTLVAGLITLQMQ